MSGTHGSVSLNPRRWLPLLALVSGLTACDAPAGPSPVLPQAETDPIATVSVRLDGRVLDLDTNNGVAGARVTLQGVAGVPNKDLDLRTIVADATGAYTLTMEVPTGWASISLDVEREGYEPATGVVPPNRVGDAVLRAYPTVTLQVGASMDTQLSPMGGGFTNNVCWFLIDERPCRRVRLDAAAGQRIDVDVLSLDGSTAFGLVTSRQQPAFSGYQRQITVSTGEFWIVGLDSKIRLTARLQ